MATRRVAAADWWPSPKVRAQLAKRLASRAGAMTTAALVQIGKDNPWFTELDAEHRSWISVVAKAGIDGFIDWFAAGGDSDSAASVFAAAPRALARRISLHQTVDLVRSTIDAVETELDGMPKADQPALRVAIVHYSREIAFAAAETYARAAEIRGAWDARLEAMVVDAVIRGDGDKSLASRASTLGWSSPDKIAVVVGPVPANPGEAVESMRIVATRRGLDVLAAPQGSRLVVIVGGTDADMSQLEAAAAELAAHFGPGPVVTGPIVDRLDDAPHSAREALSGLRAARAWPGAPRPVSSLELLPERALSGDGHARRLLVERVYQPLVDAGGDLVPTLAEFLDAGGSVEATARARFIHPNTVRYRLKRVAEITGHTPSDPRDAYVFRLAVTLGRLLD